MRRHSSFPLLCGSHLRALARLLLLAAVSVAGTAQAQSTSEAEAADPPGRVGSISLLAGPATLVDLQTGNREDAALNWPITSGWRMETGQAGRAEVRIGSTALRLDDGTTVDFVRLDDRFMQIAVLRGSVALRLRNRELLSEFEMVTERERIVFDEVGRYRIDVDRAAGQTALTAFTGHARIASNGNSFVVTDGQRGDLSAPPSISFAISAAVGDSFDDWVAARDAQDDSLPSSRYVSRETTGIEMLDNYGDWQSVDDYGPVWIPRTVPPNWAPYRYGRWDWVDPWGWTWIDEAPWGFAPFHYGRWVVVAGSWCWVPGVIVPRPVYAPALVAWFGTPGVSVSVAAPIGWFPLGPREVYVPPFRYTPRYLRVVNVQHVPNVERVTIVQTPRYVNRHPDRSTWVRGDRFGRPDPVHRAVRPPPSEWRQFIARPQPPANVPNTKRRQQADAVIAPARLTPPAAVPGSVTTPVRPPTVVPRAAETPRHAPTPAPAGTSHDVGGGGSPAAGRQARRLPRAPAAETQPPAPVVRTPVRSQSRELAPVPAQLPSVTPPMQGRRNDPNDGRDRQRRSDPPVAAPDTAPPPATIVDQAAPERGQPRRMPPPARADRGTDQPDQRTVDRLPMRRPREMQR